jgi:hypothetical protein
MAIDYLLGVVEPRPPCSACGRSDGDRDPVAVRACKEILDRSGFAARVEVVHQRGIDEDDLSSLSLEEMIAEVEGTLEMLRGLQARERQQALEQMVIEREHTIAPLALDEGQR